MAAVVAQLAFSGAGHNLPQEKPQVFADAVLELVRQAAPYSV